MIYTGPTAPTALQVLLEHLIAGLKFLDARYYLIHAIQQAHFIHTNKPISFTPTSHFTRTNTIFIRTNKPFVMTFFDVRRSMFDVLGRLRLPAIASIYSLRPFLSVIA